jgi:hypothetical protein
MEISVTSSSEATQVKLKQYKRASLLAQITIFYNLIEGIVSVFFGTADETLSLLGFGIDSFVEVHSKKRRFKSQALRFISLVLAYSLPPELICTRGIDLKPLFGEL